MGAIMKYARYAELAGFTELHHPDLCLMCHEQGTANFIATEADYRSYQHLPGDTRGPAAKKPNLGPEEQITATSLMSMAAAPVVASKRTEVLEAPRPPFFHNALHDLESIWWIAVYFLVNKEVDSPISYDTEEQRWHAGRLFYNKDARFAMFEHPTEFADCIQTLHPSVRDAAQELNVIRKEFVRCYQLAEQDAASIGKDVASNLYTLMVISLRNAASCLLADRVVLRRFSPTEITAPVSADGSRKRKKINGE